MKPYHIVTIKYEYFAEVPNLENLNPQKPGFATLDRGVVRVLYGHDKQNRKIIVFEKIAGQEGEYKPSLKINRQHIVEVREIVKGTVLHKGYKEAVATMLTKPKTEKKETMGPRLIAPGGTA